MGRLNDAAGSGGKIPGGSLRGWCAEQNAKPLFVRMSRWYFVADKDGTEIIDSLSGTDADNLRKMLAGKLRDFDGWSEQRMSGYRRWLWSVAQRGSTETLRVGLPEMEPAE